MTRVSFFAPPALLLCGLLGSFLFSRTITVEGRPRLGLVLEAESPLWAPQATRIGADLDWLPSTNRVRARIGFHGRLEWLGPDGDEGDESLALGIHSLPIRLLGGAVWRRRPSASSLSSFLSLQARFPKGDLTLGASFLPEEWEGDLVAVLRASRHVEGFLDLGFRGPKLRSLWLGGRLQAARAALDLGFDPLNGSFRLRVEWRPAAWFRLDAFGRNVDGLGWSQGLRLSFTTGEAP